MGRAFAERLRASVKAEFSMTSSSRTQATLGGPVTGSAQQQTTRTTRISTQAADLPGLGIEERWMDGPGRTAYALAFLEVAAAERDLVGKLAVVRKSLVQDPDLPSLSLRERIALLASMKQRQDDAVSLDDLANLVNAAGGDPDLPAQAADLRTESGRRLTTLQGLLTLSIQADPGLEPPSEVAARVRILAKGHGLGWADRGGELLLRIQPVGSPRRWDLAAHRTWIYEPSSDFTVASGSFEVTLMDRAGTRFETTTLEVVGVSPDASGADRALIKNFATKLEAALAGWLGNLER